MSSREVGSSDWGLLLVLRYGDEHMIGDARKCETCGDDYGPYKPCSCVGLADRLGIAPSDLEAWIVKVIVYQIAKHEQRKTDTQKWPSCTEPV